MYSCQQVLAMSRGKVIRYSETELDWIKNNQAGISRKELANKFNAKFNRDVSEQNIHGLCKRKGWSNGRNTCFKKGQATWNKGKKGYIGPNKTSFKKGQIPHNHQPIGHERITKDGYIMIKVAEPNKFRLKHQVVWEEHHGKVPKGHCLRFLDEDRTNCSIDNLMCIPRGANATINKFNPADTQDKDLNKAILLTETIKYHVKRVEVSEDEEAS